MLISTFFIAIYRAAFCRVLAIVCEAQLRFCFYYRIIHPFASKIVGFCARRFLNVNEVPFFVFEK